MDLSGKQNKAALASLLVLAIYFAFSSYSGLNAFFTGDDGGNLLNMHKYWQHSLGSVVGSALRVVTGAYRPLGGIFYFALYRLAGFNPLPFRVVCLSLMLANLLFAFTLLRRLSGSLEAAFIGAVLIANHPAMLELLYSSGTIYEILCFLFYFLTVSCYLVWREARELAGFSTLSWRQLAAVLILTGCALDSKEMAMTLPAALLLVELVYYPPGSWFGREALRSALRLGRVALAAAALVVPTIAVKVLTHNPLSEDARYGPLTLRGLLRGMRAYQSFLLYRGLSPGGITTLQWLALWTAMLVLAVALRSRAMKFGLGFLIVSLVPIALINVRNGYMVYIPLMGWALYAGSLFEWICGIAFRWRPPRVQLALKFGALLAAAMLIAHTHTTELAKNRTYFEQYHRDNRRIVERLSEQHPHLPRGASLLLVDDPLPPGFELLFLERLAHADPALELDRLKMLREPPSGAELTRYEFVIAGGWQLHDVRGISDPRPPVEVRFSPRKVRPREDCTIEIPEFAGQTVDLIVRTGVTEILQRCTLDSSGRAAWAATPESAPATMAIRWLRTGDGDWESAAGTLEIRR